jgi:uncharacterized protein YprB with RNaseH-like and TPR domain
VKPRVLYFDVETAPMRGWFWDLFETNPLEVQDHWYLLSYAYKFEGEKRVTVKALPDFRSRKHGNWDDKALVTSLWRLFNEADVLIGHNGDNFDCKKANARFIFHGLTPPDPYKTIDTLKIARRHFKFDSNRLDFIGHYLGVGRKLPTSGKHLWFGCMRNDPKSWATMKKYNIQDVILLEKVYKKLRPWAKTHPDLRVYDRADGCPKCRSTSVSKRGPSVKGNRLYQTYGCNSCHARFHGERYDEGRTKQAA